MSTTKFRVMTAEFPTITNDLKYVIYKASAPLAEVDSFTFSSPHPARTVNFLGPLEITNYIFKLFEMSGASIVRQVINDLNFTPDGEVQYFAPVMIKVDTSPGLNSGTSSFVFDGTGGTPDWRGRHIFVERVGSGTMDKDFTVQYTWDSATATFVLTYVDPGGTTDAFQVGELFNVEFEMLFGNTGSQASDLFSDVLVITNDTALTAADIGKKIIIKGAVPYLEVTLPDIDTVLEKKVTWFEFGVGSHINAKLKTFTGQVIDWGRGSLDHITGGVCESIAIFKEPITNVWRVHDSDGNFLKLGRIIANDGEAAQEFNVQALDGTQLNVADYVRIYEDFVQKLPPSQVCNFSDWGTLDVPTNTYPNKTKFSYSNGTFFHVPDRRNLYQRNTDGSRLAGLYMINQNKAHSHRVLTGGAGGSANPGKSLIRQSYNGDAYGSGQGVGTSSLGPYIEITGNSEALPETYITNQYILI